MSVKGPRIYFSKDFIDAAKYVLDAHLSQPYKEHFKKDGRSRGIKREWIDRPVHGLVHTLRTTAYAPIYLQEMKKQGKKEYQHIDEQELQKLMIAQLFFVAGRESEDSDSQAYLKYHKAGAEFFETYAKKNLRHIFSNEDIEKYKGIIADAEPKYKNLPEADIIRKAHAIELIRARQPEHLFHKKGDDEIGFHGIGRGQMMIFKSPEAAIQMCDYALNLFEATGDMKPAYEIEPGIKYPIYVVRADNKKEELRTIQYPSDTPEYKRLGKEANTALFEECQYSVERCLQQIASVQPPFGIHFNIEGIKPSMISSKPSAEKTDKASPADAKKIYYGARQYELLQEQVRCQDGIIRDKIKIPGDNNCCFNAVFVAAKHSGVRLPNGINNHYDLRMAAARELRNFYQEQNRIVAAGDDRDGTEKHRAYIHAKPWIDEMFPRVIRDYNREFRKNLQNMDEYIAEMEKLETWGGALELNMMAQVLGVKIVDHSVELPRPHTFGDENSPYQLHVSHSGHHYDFYVAPGTWQGLRADDPVLLFDKNYHQFKQQIYQQRIAKIEKQKAVLPALKGKLPSTKIPVNYDAYFQLSAEVKRLEESIQRTAEELSNPLLLEANNKRLNSNLAKEKLNYERKNRDLVEMRKIFWSEKELTESVKQRYVLLTENYQAYIQLLNSALEELMDLNHQRNEIAATLGMASKEYKVLSEKIEKKQIENAKNQKTYQADLEKLTNEIEFIIREMPDIDIRTREMARMNSMKARVQRILHESQSKLKVKTESVVLTHLKNFLGVKFNPKSTLEENIDLFFQDPNVRGMLFMSSLQAKSQDQVSVPIFLNLPTQDKEITDRIDNAYITGETIQTIFTNCKGAQYNPEYLEHFRLQLKRMIEAEMQQGERFALYNALSPALCVGNDIIRHLNAMLFAQDKSLFRLFSDNFQFADAEGLRKHVFDDKKVDDKNVEFHLRGIACTLSPFQITQNESSLDFWVRGVNLNQFDRWTNEILPKIKHMTSDQAVIDNLSKEYQQLVELSNQLGSRMMQIMLTPEDMNKYAWISGAYGYQLPSVGLGGVKTQHLSDALDYYQQSPDQFLKDNKRQRDEFFRSFTLTEKQKRDAYDLSYSSDAEERRSLAQLQARYYLHPEVSSRAQVNTFFSLPVDQKIIDAYNNQAELFAEKVAALVIKAKLEGKFQPPQVDKPLPKELPPQDLLKSIIALRPYTYVNSDKLKNAFELIKQQAMVGVNPILIPQSPKFYKMIQASDLSNIQEEAIKEDMTLQALLRQSFYYAIVQGDVETFNKLLNYYQSSNYDSKKYPIDFDKLTDGKNTGSALLLAAKFNQTAMITRLLELSSESKSTWSYLTKPSYINIKRTVQETDSNNSPLHYLAERGNVEAFLNLAKSLYETRSWSSYIYSVANSINQEQNTPLHILAIHDPNLVENRLEILKFLCSDENKALFKQIMGTAAITTPNNQGLSPIMIAALTQNIDAVMLLANRAELSDNQKTLYLWLAQDPINRLQFLQQNLADYGNIPGFVASGWKIPEGFKAKVEIETHEMEERKPLTIRELQYLFRANLSMDDKKAQLKAYDELFVAQGVATHHYISALVSQLTDEHATTELIRLNNVIKERNISIKYDSESPLISAAKQGDIPTVISLLEGKDTLKVQRTAVDAEGKSALHYLAAQHDTDEAIIKMLKISTWSQSLGGKLSSSYEPTTIVDKNGSNPIHYLAHLGKTETLKAIDEAFSSAATMTYLRSTSGIYTKLYNACWQQDKIGKTPLMISVFEHPKDKEAIGLFAKAMGLSEADKEKYEQLSDAIGSGVDLNIQNAIGQMKEVKSWNSKFNNPNEVKKAMQVAALPYDVKPKN